MYRYTALVILCVAITLGARAPQAAGVDVATLKKIGSSVDARAGVIAIEASDPVPYVASQPDPQQFVIELRDIVATGFADNFKPGETYNIGGGHHHLIEELSDVVPKGNCGVAVAGPVPRFEDLRLAS